MKNKKKSRMVWTSYGVIRVVLRYLSISEKTLTQAANKFFYDKAVSRAVPIFRVPRPIYYISRHENQNMLVEFWANSGMTKVTRNNLLLDLNLDPVDPRDPRRG